jgi:peptidyl-tRNA hydrolase
MGFSSSTRRLYALFFLLPVAVSPFIVAPKCIRHTSLARAAQKTVEIEAILDDEKVTSLFAWVSRAFAGDPEYNNLMLAIAAIFGNLPEDSSPVRMVKEARKLVPPEEKTVGDPFPIEERERHSLGAMGAGQWTGQFMTRPHALLELQNITSVEDWVQSLPRGCRRTIKKALDQNFTVISKPIKGGEPAPHSSLAHFRCVVAHEVRLLSYGGDGFVDALAEAMGRYMGTTRMTGEIREYRNQTTGKVIAIAHEVRKGKTIRGQWFYANDEAAKNYVWFHSVYDLVRRSIDAEGITCVDLGPSGSDSFSELKARYGFRSVDDWPAIADYHGDFWYIDGPRRSSWFNL